MASCPSAAFSGRGSSRSTWSSRPWLQWLPQTEGWRRRCRLTWWGWEEAEKTEHEVKIISSLVLLTLYCANYDQRWGGLKQEWMCCEAFDADTLFTTDWPWNHSPCNNISLYQIPSPHALSEATKPSISSHSATHWSDLPLGLISCRLSGSYCMVFTAVEKKLLCCTLWGGGFLSLALSRALTGDSTIKHSWKAHTADVQVGLMRKGYTLGTNTGLLSQM